MNTREKFLEVMRFNPDASPPKWEFGYWGATIKRWYSEGLEEQSYPAIPTEIGTVASSLYTAAWTHEWRKSRNLFERTYGEREAKIVLPDGIGVLAGGLYWPTQGFPLDRDVAACLDFDQITVVVQVEQLFHPRFEPAVVSEDERYLDYVDIDGITRRFQKDEGVIPSGMSWPIKDRDSWEEIKSERLALDGISQRFPDNWAELLKEYKARDYPLAVGGYPLGFFGTPAHLMGYENLFYGYYDQPDLIKDMLQHLTNLWIAVWEEVTAQVDVDVAHIWEDISFGRGSMVSPAVFREFMTPYYKQVTDFLRSKRVDIVLVDTDGDCRQLIPLFLEAGATGLYPMEVTGGMDVATVREQYPTLQILGGVPKHEIALGRERIDELLEVVSLLLKKGGYIPHGDHAISPDVSWECFKYYREKLNSIIDSDHGA